MADAGEEAGTRGSQADGGARRVPVQSGFRRAGVPVAVATHSLAAGGANQELVSRRPGYRSPCAAPHISEE